MSSLGFDSQAGTASSAMVGTRVGHGGGVGNGLLNAVSANARTSEARSPTGLGVPGMRALPTSKDAI